VTLDAFDRRSTRFAGAALRHPLPSIRQAYLDASIAFVDTWGNVQLMAEPADLEAAIGRVSNGDELRVEAADGSSLDG